MLTEKIKSDLKEAMKAGDTMRRGVLRMLEASIVSEEIAKKKREEGLSDDEVLVLLARGVKQRRDSITQFEAGGRDDLAEKERAEMTILEAYLPEQMSESDIRIEVEKIIADLGATEPSDKGKVMGVAMARLKGKADGSVVRTVVEESLKK